MAFWYGSGSSDPYLCLTDLDADPGGPKTCGSGYGCESGSTTPVFRICRYPNKLSAVFRMIGSMLIWILQWRYHHTGSKILHFFFPFCQIFMLFCIIYLFNVLISKTFRSNGTFERMYHRYQKTLLKSWVSKSVNKGLFLPFFMASGSGSR